MKSIDSYLQEALNELVKWETVSVVPEKVKAKLFPDFYSCWELKTGVYLNEDFIDLDFYIIFASDFPLSLPTVVLEKESYDKIKYIPHVDTIGLVCLFNPDQINLNYLAPIPIIMECIKQSKKIIELGLKKINLSDFETEFLAYWTDQHVVNLIDTCISLVSPNSFNPTNLQLSVLKSSIDKVFYVLHQNDKKYKQFQDYCSLHQLNENKFDVFFTDQLDIEYPPFDYNTVEAIKLIEKKGKPEIQKLEKYIRRISYPPIIFTTKTIGETTHFIGWRHKMAAPKKMKGFRDGKVPPLNGLKCENGKKKINRFKVESLLEDRLSKRTSGIVKNTEKLKINIAGVGSIGSNLLHFLDSFDRPNFTLIDPDSLKIENLARHLCDFKDVNKNKVESLRERLITRYPLRNVKAISKSFISVIRTDSEFINEHDFQFICIGKPNINRWIFERIRLEEISVPTFFLWVEPYLSGGHIIYLHPKDFRTYKSFFKNEIYKYNVICKSEYENKNPKLSLKEAGCQTSYIPYGGTDVILFLSSCFHLIHSIIVNKDEKSQAFTWVGNIQKLPSEIKQSLYVQDKQNQSIINHI